MIHYHIIIKNYHYHYHYHQNFAHNVVMIVSVSNRDRLVRLAFYDNYLISTKF